MTRRSPFSGAHRWCAIAAAASSVLVTAPAQANDFMDTWVTFAFEDPHVLANAEDGFPRGGFYPDERASTFFDNYDSQYSGRETLSHLVLYKRMPTVMNALEAEASLVLRWSLYHDPETGKPGNKLRDDGSFIRLNYYTKSARARRVGDAISLTAFPYDSERFKLGYSYDLSWGGKRTFLGNEDTVPGIKLEYNGSAGDKVKVNAFVGAKNARLLDDSINEQQTYYGLLGGVGTGLFSRVRLDLQGGFFQKGAFPPKGQLGEDGQDLLAGRIMYAYGLSARAGYHVGTPIGRSADFRLYRRDPYALIEDLRPERYDSTFSYAVESEASRLGQTLIDPDELGTTVIQPATAADVNARLKYRYLRAHADVVYRSLSFILFNVPGMSPYYDFPDASVHTDEIYGAVGMDYFLPRWRLTPGFTLGYQKPATYSGGIAEVDDVIDDAESEGATSTTIVVRDEGNFEILPAGQNKFDILTVKGSCRWDLGDALSFLSEVSYTLDKNQTRYDKQLEGDGTSQRVFDDPDVFNKISVSLFLQARF